MTGHQCSPTASRKKQIHYILKISFTLYKSTGVNVFFAITQASDNNERRFFTVWHCLEFAEDITTKKITQSENTPKQYNE